MVNNLLSKGRKLIFSQQQSVLSAAGIIMVMIAASRILGVVRQSILTHFFTTEELSLFFAAFRLPDLVFEVFFFGMFSSAFIPVFTKALKKNGHAWEIAGRVVSISFFIFLIVGGILLFWANPLYNILAPGFSDQETARIANLARVLFAAQGFFVISYVLTGVLESLRRFLIPALAPIFYNLGLILGIVFLTPTLGLFAPAVGAVIGAFLHLAIQLPLAVKLGFRPTFNIIPNKGVKQIGRLAFPRVIDLSFQQVAKSVELGLASIVSTASYTYFYLGNSLQLVPVSFFGTSLAKAAFPTLSAQADNPKRFSRTLFSTLSQIAFLILPMVAILVVLRIPIIRIIYGREKFDWEATVQTGMVLSAFAFGIAFQAFVALLARAFYALHDTKTPVAASLVAVSITVIGNFFLIQRLGLPVWGLAASFTFGTFVQATLLLYFINRRLKVASIGPIVIPMLKSLLSASLAAGVMFFLIKIFDRAVWVKQLSFLGRVPVGNLNFESFVVDTRYTFNLIVLTVFVAVVGMAIYIATSYIMRSQELYAILRFINKKSISAPPQESEPLSPPTTETA